MNNETGNHPDERDLSDSPFPTPHSAIRILVVDDEPSVCKIISRYLAAEGYDCARAASGEEAWRALQAGSFSLLVTDVMMPGMSGIELLTKTREQLPDVAVIMVTAVDDRNTAISALKAGAYGYLIKPINENEVLISVANALERRRLTLLSKQYEQHLQQEVLTRTAEVRQREMQIILRLMSAAEYRDDETGAHIRRIGLFSAIMAEAAGWDRAAVDDIRLTAPMHDVGKIGIPDNILMKPGKLTAEEFDVVKTHSNIGARILSGSGVPMLDMARDIALCHHERYDGAGYPNGKAGKDIPESARIVAITDVHDALRSHRVYRPALSEDEAMAIMVKGRGSQFDPDLFDLFISLTQEFRGIRGLVENVESLLLQPDDDSGTAKPAGSVVHKLMEEKRERPTMSIIQHTVEAGSGGEALVVRVICAGLNSGLAIDEVRSATLDLLAKDSYQLVILDMSDVEALNSEGLGMLLSISKRVYKGGGELRIAGLKPSFQAMYELCRMHRVIPACKTVAEALRTGRSGRQGAPGVGGIVQTDLGHQADGVPQKGEES